MKNKQLDEKKTDFKWTNAELQLFFLFVLLFNSASSHHIKKTVSP